jgi:hypothetical protein
MRIGPIMHCAVIALAITVMALAMALAFGYAHQPSNASPKKNQAAQKFDANGNLAVRNR